MMKLIIPFSDWSLNLFLLYTICQSSESADIHQFEYLLLLLLETFLSIGRDWKLRLKVVKWTAGFKIQNKICFLPLSM